MPLSGLAVIALPAARPDLRRVLHLVQQRHEARALATFSEAKRVVGVCEVAGHASEGIVGKRARDLPGRKPWRLLVPAAARQAQHSLIEQRRVLRRSKATAGARKVQ